MLLRSTIEKVLPTVEGENRLSKQGRHMAFRGRYLGRKFMGTELQPGSYPHQENDSEITAPDYHDVVLRTGFFGVKHISHGGLLASMSSARYYHVNLSDTDRIRAVETAARVIKSGLALLTISAVAVFGPPDLDRVPSPDIPFGAENIGALVYDAGDTIVDATFDLNSLWLEGTSLEAEHRVGSPEGSQVGARTQRPQPTANLRLPND